MTLTVSKTHVINGIELHIAIDPDDTATLRAPISTMQELFSEDIPRDVHTIVSIAETISESLEILRGKQALLAKTHKTP